MIDMLPAVAGFFGSIGTQIFNEIQAGREHKRLLETKQLDRQYEIEMLNIQHTENVRQHGRNMDAESWAGMKTAIDHDSALSNLVTDKWVNNLRALVRPVITFSAIFAVGASLMIYGSESDPAIVGDIAMLSTAWWFGDRGRDLHKGRVRV